MMAGRTRSFGEKGATIVEFAMVLPVLCITLLGFFDLGYRVYLTTVMEGALQYAARQATVGTATPAQIEAGVKARIADISSRAAVVIITKSYSEFSEVGKPEKITQDTRPKDVYNVGDCYEDANENGVYDLDRGADGLGGAEDIVSYQVTVTYPRLVPIFGISQNQTVKGSTILRNQPYAARSGEAPVKCT